MVTVAFDKISMEWIVVARLRLDSQASAGYALSFKKNSLTSAEVIIL